MDPIYWVMLLGAVIVAFVLGGALVWYVLHRRQERRLRERYGPEYDHVLDRTGKKRFAERELIRREERVRHFDIHPLTSRQRTRYAEAWRHVQALFVDEPKPAASEAHALVTEVMEERGYPMGDFEQRAEDLSVDHPHVVRNYREAHALTQGSARGEADTEDLRQAMVHYRSLFEELLEAPVTEHTTKEYHEERKEA